MEGLGIHGHLGLANRPQPRGVGLLQCAACAERGVQGAWTTSLTLCHAAHPAGEPSLLSDRVGGKVRNPVIYPDALQISVLPAVFCAQSVEFCISLPIQATPGQAARCKFHYNYRGWAQGWAVGTSVPWSRVVGGCRGCPPGFFPAPDSARLRPAAPNTSSAKSPTPRI